MDLNAIKERALHLSRRELTITALTLLFIVMLAPYMFLYSPTQQQLRLKQQRLTDLNQEIAMLSTAIRQQAEKVQDISQPTFTLPKAVDLSGMIAAISHEAGLTGVEFVSITHEGFAYRGRFMEMRLRLELKAGYRELHDFLRRLSVNQRMFLVQSLRFESNEALYPQGVAILRAVTYLRKQ